MKNFAFILLVIFTYKTNAQNNWMLFPSDSSKIDSTAKNTEAALEVNTSGEIYGDKRINDLLNKKIAIDSTQNKIDGYRVQLFSGVGFEAKEEALKIRSEFVSKNPKTKAYLLYDKPNWKVRVGDFRTRLKALEFQRSIYSDFNQGFVVQDEIPMN